MVAFSSVSSSPGSRPRAGLRLPRFLPMRLGGTSAGMSGFVLVAIAEGCREWSCAGGGATGANGGLVGGVGKFEREEREEQEELAEEDLVERSERVGVMFESGDPAELDGRRAMLEGVDLGTVEVEGGNGYS